MVNLLLAEVASFTARKRKLGSPIVFALSCKKINLKLKIDDVDYVSGRFTLFSDVFVFITYTMLLVYEYVTPGWTYILLHR